MTTPSVIGIGNPESQQVFLSNYKPFLNEQAFLMPVVKDVFLNRVILPPPAEVMGTLDGLSDDDPRVQAVDDKYKSDLIVYTLGRIAVDDFSELVVLAGNGWGVGALKILRGMYERVVTSAYIAKTPQASRAFADSFWTHKAKVLRRISTLDPKYMADAPPEKISEIQAEAKRAQDNKRESTCKCCGQIKTIDAWTSLDLASMARIAGSHLEDLYLSCYLEPTAHMHATGAGMTARMEHTGDSWLYKLNTDNESHMAIILGHNVLLQNLRTQNDYFSLGMFESINLRFTAFHEVWGKPDKNEIPDVVVAEN